MNNYINTRSASTLTRLISWRGSRRRGESTNKSETSAPFCPAWQWRQIMKSARRWSKTEALNRTLIISPPSLKLEGDTKFSILSAWEQIMGSWSICWWTLKTLTFRGCSSSSWSKRFALFTTSWKSTTLSHCWSILMWSLQQQRLWTGVGPDKKSNRRSKWKRQLWSDW